MTNIYRKSFRHGDFQLSYLDNLCDSDLPPVVMLHGFTANAESNWLDSGWIVELTQAGRRVLALDALGHGHSDKPHDSQFYSSATMATSSIALLAQLGFAQADYVGYSMGARMSAFAAIHYPNTVRQLLLGGMGINLKFGMGNPQPIANALLASDLRSIKDRNARRFRRLAEKTGNDLTALAHCIMSSRQKIVAEDLHKITAKTLILVGADDKIGGSPQALAPFISQSQAREIADCNHFNALTHTDFRRTGLDFLLPTKRGQ